MGEDPRKTASPGLYEPPSQASTDPGQPSQLPLQRPSTEKWSPLPAQAVGQETPGGPPKAGPRARDRLDVTCQVRGQLIVLRMPADGSSDGMSLIRRARERAGTEDLRTLSFHDQPESTLPLHVPLYSILPVGCTRLLLRESATSACGAHVADRPQASIFSPDQMRCLSCQITTATPLHMQAHAMMEGHIRRDISEQAGMP